MLKIGLTGGIGCGKTVVANLFKQNRIEIIDADEIAHALVEPGKAGLNRIVHRFGANILDPHGHLNRATLRDIVFNSPRQRKSLEAILHPLIYQHIETEIGQLRGRYCVVCVPLLLETGRRALFDRILIIDCPVELQVERVRIRDNLSDDQIARILNSQAGREERLAAADDVIVNDSDLAALDKQVEKLHNFYSEISKGSGWSN
ncbi:MAG: dephospho-CoA kinase [Methylococcaceae bacterium]|nr:dephospho-CoA kinase [Methylococcaceae bacterium]